MGWRYTLQREAIPLDRQDLRLIKDGTDASLPPTNIATRIRVCDARFDHDALANGPISTFHSSSHVQTCLYPYIILGSISIAYTPSLFCRKLRLISHPTSCQLKRHDFLEIMQRFEHLLQGHLLLRPALPRRPVQRSEHQVIVANDIWFLLGEKGGKKMFHVVLMSNEQITEGAVAACLVEREHLHWIDMDHQWQLPLVHFAITLRATRKAHILIGIEKEAVLRRLFAKLWHGFLFSLRHCYVATP